MGNAAVHAQTSRRVHRGSGVRTGMAVPPRPWLQDLWLWILLLGPPLAPLLLATGIDLLRPIADGIYFIGWLVCPKPSMHYVLFNEAVAVCASCWGAVWGLWAVRLHHGRAGEGFGPFARLRPASFWASWNRLPLALRLSVLAAGFLPWAIDVMLWDTGAWSSPLAFMAVIGFLGGLSAGAFLFPVSAAMRARTLAS